MAKRPCLDCGMLSAKARCPRCESQRNRERGSSTARGYDRQHEQRREQWRPEVEAGLVDCWRCKQRIEAGEPWHLGHDDHDRSIYRGPECVDCNCATSGRVGGTPGT